MKIRSIIIEFLSNLTSKLALFLSIISTIAFTARINTTPKYMTFEKSISALPKTAKAPAK
jgi:hypothetical protein